VEPTVLVVQEMPSGAARLAHPKKNLAQVTVHRSHPVRRTAIASAFAVLHAVIFSFAMSTAGEPYQTALAQQAKLDNETNATNATAAPFLDEQDASVSADAAPEAIPGGKSEISGGFGDEEWPLEDDDVPSSATVDAPNGSDAFLNTTKKERPLPHEWLPSALACALIFISVTANALFYLLCHWSIGFKVRAHCRCDQLPMPRG
jgi:hypothetical protein